MILSESAVRALLYEAMRHEPNECCGLLIKRLHAPPDLRYAYAPISNVADNPRQSFLMSVDEVRAIYRNHCVIGTYHSHPGGAYVTAQPSAHDRVTLTETQLPMAIILPCAREIRCFRLVNRQITESSVYRLDTVGKLVYCSEIPTPL